MSEENLITIEDAARRMLEKLMQDAELFQEETVDEIESKFGAEFVIKRKTETWQ